MEGKGVGRVIYEETRTKNIKGRDKLGFIEHGMTLKNFLFILSRMIGVRAGVMWVW